jgi:hypothetical protein
MDDDDISIQFDQEVSISDGASVNLDDEDVSVIQQKNPQKPSKKQFALKPKTTKTMKPLQKEPEFNDRTFEMLSNPTKRRPEQPPPPPPMEDNEDSESMIPESEMEDDDGNSFNEIQPSDGFNTIDEEKQDIIYKLYRLEQKGLKIKKFNMHSDILEMRTELHKIKKDIQMNSSVKFSRRMLLTLTSGVEFLNKTFDPVGAELEGWSESVMENLNDGEYDSIFERLHDKYAGKMNTPPEIELFLMLGGSAIMFHMTSKMFKGVPNMEEFAKKNPNFMNDILQKMTDKQNVPQTQTVKITEQMSDTSSVLSFDSDKDGNNVKQLTVSQTTAGGTRRGRKPKITSTNTNTIDL